MKFRKSLLINQLIVLAGLVSAHKSVLIPNLRLIVDSFQITYGFAGLLIGAYMFASSIGSLGWALYADYTGLPRKALMGIGLGGGIFFTFLSYSFSHPILFAIFYILAGMALSVVWPLSTTIIMDLAEQERRTVALMYFSVFSGFGYVAGFGIGLLLGSVLGDWKYPLFVIMILLLIIGSISLILLVEPPKGFSEDVLHPVLMKVYKYPFTLRPEDIQIITGNQSNYYITLQGIFGIIASGTIEVWLLQYLIREAGANEVIGAVLMGLGAIGSIFGIGIAKLTDSLYMKHRRARPLMATLASTVSAFLMIYFLLLPLQINMQTDDVVVGFSEMINLAMSNRIVLMAILLFFTTMLISTPIGSIKASIISEVNLPEHRATVISGISIIETFTKSIGIMVVGFLIDFLGNIRIPLILAISMWIVSAFFWTKVSYYVIKDSWKVKLILKERSKQIENGGGGG